MYEPQRRYAATDKGRATMERYERSDRGRETRRRIKAEWKARQRDDAQFRAKNAARERVRRAVRTGLLEKRPCFCGSASVHGHHPVGYLGGDALVVEWLCTRHHAEAHR